MRYYCSCGQWPELIEQELPPNVRDGERLALQYLVEDHKKPCGEACGESGAHPALYPRGNCVICPVCGEEVGADPRRPALVGHHADKKYKLPRCDGVGGINEANRPKRVGRIIKPLPSLQPQEPTLLGRLVNGAGAFQSAE